MTSGPQRQLHVAVSEHAEQPPHLDHRLGPVGSISVGTCRVESGPASPASTAQNGL
jgi:hypothetical protein